MILSVSTIKIKLMKSFYLIVFLFPIIQMNSQNKEVLVIDSVTAKPISFVTVHFLNTNSGTYTNENGIFDIIPNSYDSIKLHHLTYSEKILNMNNIGDTIKLSPDAVILKEVILNNGKAVTKFIDFPRKKGSYGSFPVFENSELLSYLIPNETIVNTKIVEIGVKFEKKIRGEYPRNIRTAYRMNIYSSKNKEIDKKIYESPVFTISTYEKEKMDISISDGITFIESGIFIGIEIIGDINSEGKFTREKSLLNLVLTDNKIKDYQAETFLRYFDNKEKLMPLNDIFRDHVDDKIKRNLSLSFLLIE